MAGAVVRIAALAVVAVYIAPMIYGFAILAGRIGR